MVTVNGTVQIIISQWKSVELAILVLGYWSECGILVLKLSNREAKTNTEPVEKVWNWPDWYLVTGQNVAYWYQA